MSWARYSATGSWHLTYLFPGVTVTGNVKVRTLCGRLEAVGSPTVAQPPEDERTCERCFQLREVRA